MDLVENGKGEHPVAKASPTMLTQRVVSCALRNNEFKQIVVIRPVQPDKALAPMFVLVGSRLGLAIDAT